MSKTINCHCDAGIPQTMKRYAHNARWQIKELQTILDRFGSEDGFDEYVDNGMEIRVGLKSVDIDFNPNTWEWMEDTIKFFICHLIEAEELDKFPYYDALIEKYSKDLKIERGNFQY